MSASGALLAGYPATAKPAPPERVPAATAWPNAQRAAVPANLPDGTAYQPLSFLDAHTSIGTALSKNTKSLRLVLVGTRQPVRQLRVVPLNAGRSFRAVAVTGNLLAWVEGTSPTGIEIWKTDRQGAKPAQKVASANGSADSYHSQYDLVINDGRLYWASSGNDNLTNIRSVALTGGPITTQTVPGNWQLSTWPWLADGITATSGTTRLKNLITSQEVKISATGPRSTTRCTPTWCQVVSLSHNGYNHIELMHPDGTSRESVAGKTAATVITDAAPLDQFEVFSDLGPDSDLTGNTQLLVYEITTRRTVQISPDAGKVSYSNGVLWWATGNQETFIWHSLDLRTV